MKVLIVFTLLFVILIFHQTHGMEKSNPKQIKKIYQSELKSVGNKVMSVLRKLNKKPKQRRKKKNKGIAKQVFIIFFSHVHRSMNSHFK